KFSTNINTFNEKTDKKEPMLATPNATTPHRQTPQWSQLPQAAKATHFLLISFTLIMAIACNNAQQRQQPDHKTTGSIERLDPALDVVLNPEATIEIIAEGFEWSEGPLWVESEQMLLFSDVPTNTVYKWTEEN